jgi:pyruvate, orthophosphate dikinase
MMVFGNKSSDSGTGVAFTRNPATGQAVFYGEYLEQVIHKRVSTFVCTAPSERAGGGIATIPMQMPMPMPMPRMIQPPHQLYRQNQAEGEDVVSGVRTPHSLAFLQNNYPEIYAELDGYQKQLEKHHRDVCACVLAFVLVWGVDGLD